MLGLGAMGSRIARRLLAAGHDVMTVMVVSLSVKHRVLSDYTALLVLETEADYARFGIDRRALADILVVKDGRVAPQKRGPETVAAAPPTPPAPNKPKCWPSACASGWRAIPC